MKIMILAVSVLFVGVSFAETENDYENVPAQKDIVVTKTFASAQTGKFHVIVRKDGHLQGQPFLIETRPSCGGPADRWRIITPADSKSACKIDLDSLKFDKKKAEISIQIFGIDWNEYNEQARAKKGIDVVPKCKKTPETYRVSLSTLCKGT